MKEFEVPDTRPLVVKAKDNKKCGLELPLTLGKPMPNTKEYDECMAMDSCIKNVFTGFRTDTMFSTMPMFVGYGMLSNVSQEALIRAGVETVADEMTRKFVRWTYHTDDGKENKEDLISKMDEQTKKYKLKEIFNEAMLKDGYFGGCLVYIDMGDLDDEEKEEPLIFDKKTFKAGSFRGFKVIEPVNIYPGWYNTNDPTDEYYFKPKYWYILGKKYHESRFLYFAGNEAPLLLKPTYNFFGIPQAQLALDYVAHFVANREAAQELLNKFSLTCWKTNMTQALKGHGCNDLVSRVRMFNRMKNNNGTMVLDKETEDMLQINTPLSGVRDIVEMSLNLLTAVWRIPKIKYLGEGEGGLNASSKEQMRSFYDYITSQQEKEFTHPMEIVSKIFQLNLGLDINEALSFEFPPLVEMDDKERADLNKEQADRDAIYLANGVLSQEEVRKRLSLDKHSEYSMIDVDDMPEQPEPQPLGNVDKEEEEEEVKVANDGLVMDEFKEEEHPRDKGGRFISKIKEIFSGPKVGFKSDSKSSIDKKEVKRRFQVVKDQIQHRQKETACGVTENGDWLGYFEGDEKSVPISPEILIQLKGGTFVHNHPYGGPFSADDLKIASKYGIKNLVVYSNDGETYKITIGNAEKLNEFANRLDRYCDIAIDRNSDLVDDLIKNGYLKEENRNEEIAKRTIKDYNNYYKENEKQYDFIFEMEE